MTATQTRHNVVSRDEWLKARMAHLEAEKEFTRRRDELARQRRELPWVKVEKNYVFDGPKGRQTLADLFAGRSQLIVYHFMLGPNWEEGLQMLLPSWLITPMPPSVHLAHRDVAFAAPSRAPMLRIQSFKNRMGWRFPVGVCIRQRFRIAITACTSRKTNSRAKSLTTTGRCVSDWKKCPA